MSPMAQAVQRALCQRNVQSTNEDVVDSFNAVDFRDASVYVRHFPTKVKLMSDILCLPL